MKLIDFLELCSKGNGSAKDWDVATQEWDRLAEGSGAPTILEILQGGHNYDMMRGLLMMIRAGAFEDYQPEKQALNCLNGGVPQPILSQINQQLGLPLGHRFWVSEWSGSAQKWNATVYVRNDETNIPTEYRIGGGKLL